MRIRAAAVAALLLLAASSVTVRAAPGDLDPAFGTDGRVVVPLDGIDDLALDGRNRIIVIGFVVEFLPGGGPRPIPRRRTFVARYDQNGRLDPMFGEGGVAPVRSGAIDFGVLSSRLAVQPDGRILTMVVTSTSETSPDGGVTIERLDDAGRRDPSFAEAGALPLTTGVSTFDAPDLLVLPDGRFSVPALACTIDACVLRVVRYDATGTRLGDVRTSDGLDGVDGNPFVRAVLTHDGRFLLAAQLDVLDPSLLLVRYDALGAIDRSYPNDGRTVTTLDLPPLVAPPVTVDAKDRPLAAGIDGKHIAVLRFLPSGQPDDLFTATRIASAGLAVSEASNVVLQPDGRIVVAGMTGSSSLEPRWLLATLAPNGGLDASFGDDGIVVGAPGSSLGEVAIQPDGKIVAVSAEGADLNLARFLGSARACGDADGNGELSVTDGVRVLRAAADLPSSCLAAFCDTDADGTIGVTDGVRTLRAAAALPITLDCPSAEPTAR